MRAARSPIGTARAANSGSSQPTPTPRMARPPLSTSSVATDLASTTGLRNGSTTTDVPSRTRWVRAATHESVLKTSRCGLSAVHHDLPVGVYA